MNDSHPAIVPYRRLATETAALSHVPYSGEPAAVVLIVDGGRWIPGVRVESATFSLTIPPLLNAVTTAVALETVRIHAAVASRPFRPHELAFARRMHLLKDLSQITPSTLGTAPEGPIGEQTSPFITVRAGDPPSSDDNLESAVRDGLLEAGALNPRHAISVARRIAARAYVPESDFPVGALVEVDPGGYIPGVNVEHEDWMHILCAERNALGTAISYGHEHISSVYLTCTRAPGCTPCGACRQLLAELAPTSALWMDGDNDSPVSTDPVTLLPGFFAGNRLSRDT